MPRKQKHGTHRARYLQPRVIARMFYRSFLLFITPFAMTARRDCSFCYRERVTHWNDSTNETAYARHVIAPTSIP